MDRTALAVMLALTVTGCSGQHTNGTQSQAAAGQPVSAEPGTEASSAPEDASAPTVSSLPVYPGATKMAVPGMKNPMTITHNMCGTDQKISSAVYTVKGADATSVAKWYADRISGAVTVDMTQELGEGSGAIQMEVFEPNGASAAVIDQAETKLSNAEKRFGMGGEGPTLGLETFDPPIPHDLMALYQQAVSSDPAAKQSARAQLKAKCGANSAGGG